MGVPCQIVNACVNTRPYRNRQALTGHIGKRYYNIRGTCPQAIQNGTAAANYVNLFLFLYLARILNSRTEVLKMLKFHRRWAINYVMPPQAMDFRRVLAAGRRGGIRIAHNDRQVGGLSIRGLDGRGIHHPNGSNHRRASERGSWIWQPSSG